MTLTAAVLAFSLAQAAPAAQPPAEVVVDDAGTSTPAPASVPAPDEAITAPSAADLEAPEPAFNPSVRPFAWLRGALGVDTRFDSPAEMQFGENVAELSGRALLGADITLSSHLKLKLEGRGWVRAVTQRNFDRAKATFEPQLGEAYVDWYTAHADFRFGTQRIPLGANLAFAAVDVLNPVDARGGIIGTSNEDALIPILAARAQGEVGPISWLLAYAPFFVPHQYALFGQDEALLQPALAPAFPVRRFDPSIEDLVQPHLLETRRPTPMLGDVAFRVRTTGTVHVGATWVTMNEKVPTVVVDPELAQALAQQNAGAPVDAALALSLQNRFAAGEQLVKGTYGRTHVFGLEGSALLGPGQLDVDVSYSPRQTLMTPELNSIAKPVMSWVATYASAEDSMFNWAVSYFGSAAFSVQADEQLALMEPATARGAARTAVFHLISAYGAVHFFDKRLELALRGSFEPVQKSFFISPRASWLFADRLSVWVSGEIFEGSKYSVFGYFSRNDRILVGASLDVL